MAKKLLLADDSVTIQKVVGISFANEDVELVTVDNGDDAVLRAREIRPDVVLADVVMPGKNGYEVCEALKNDPELAHVPVLLLTGTFEAFDDERAQRCGAAGHVAKPFEAQALVDRVRDLLAHPPPAPVVSVDPGASGATVAIGKLGEEPAPAAPSAAGSDAQGFDFFEEALDEMPAPSAAPMAAPIDLDASGGAFAFAEDDMVAPPATPVPDAMGSTGDGTVVMAAESPVESAATQIDPPFAGDFELAGDDPLAGIASDAPGSDSSDVFDFAVGGSDDLDPLDGMGGDDLAQETVLDPDGASGYDVSSSDLGAPPALEPEPISDLAASPDLPPGAAMPPALPPEPDTAAALLAPAEASPAATALIDESSLEDLDSLEADLDAPLASFASSDPNEASEPGYAAFAEPRQDSGETTHDSSALAGMALAEIEPKLRESVHDTLEKIAWESLGGLTDEIVRQAVERIERAAWEVIPQMAENLIREEIRRMKGE